MAWVIKVAASADWITSVCTGSLILGAASLLQGYRAACHWAWRDYLSLFGAEPVAERVVVDRNRITGRGVTAGIDFGVTLVAKLCGTAYAQAVQLGLEYDPHPPFQCGSPDQAGPALTAAVLSQLDKKAPLRRSQLEVAARALPEQS